VPSHSPGGGFRGRQIHVARSGVWALSVGWFCDPSMRRYDPEVGALEHVGEPLGRPGQALLAAACLRSDANLSTVSRTDDAFLFRALKPVGAGRRAAQLRKVRGSGGGRPRRSRRRLLRLGRSARRNRLQSQRGEQGLLHRLDSHGLGGGRRWFEELGGRWVGERGGDGWVVGVGGGAR